MNRTRLPTTLALAPTMLALVLLAPALPACAGLLSREAPAAESAHTVFLSRPGCAYVVAKASRGGYAVLAPRGGPALARGDLLLGPLRRGGVSLERIPFPSSEVEGRGAFEIAGHDLALAEAQHLWREACAG